MIPKSIIRGVIYVLKKPVSHLKKNIKVAWVSAEFNLSGTFMFIDKKIFHLMKLCPVQIPESLSMPCLPKLNYIYKLICQINKRSLLDLQQEIAYYLKGTFQIQWETSAAF